MAESAPAQASQNGDAQQAPVLAAMEEKRRDAPPFDPSRLESDMPN